MDEAAAVAAFTFDEQKLELDISFSPREVRGRTTINVQPSSSGLREIHLNCRQLKPTSVTVAGRNAAFNYSDLYDRLSLYPTTGIEQYHFPQNRLRRHESGAEEELVIFIPDKLRIKEIKEPGSDDVSFDPLEVVIGYTLDDFRDGLHFVGVEDGDSRYPHVFTRNSPFAGFASCFFPCLDDGTKRCNFEVSIRYPRTVGEALSKNSGAQDEALANGTHKADSVMSESDDDPNDLSEEEKALEMWCICSGVLTDDIIDPTDTSRKTASFHINTPTGVLPQHIGIAIAPFEEVDLSEYRDTSEDDRLQDEAIKVHAFCLPGKEDELRNSAMIVARTFDSFTDRYQTYRFGKSYKLVFVDDMEYDTAHTMSLTICSSRLLFPETVWEPLEHTTRVLVHAVASQWIGVDIVAQDANDHWVIVGGSWFMAEYYLRELFGRNDHRFRQKMMIDKIMQLDIRRPSLYELGKYLQLDPGEREFMELKSLAVLFILHNRLVKASGKNGVDRCLYRMLFQHGNGALDNGAISTDAFLSICEKVGHQKLDNFFRQWVYGSGCPTFECSPQFNKKKQVVQLTIKQTQAAETVIKEERSLTSNNFMREAKERSHGFFPDAEWPAFVGPMTIRIHEADGTPYEHIVDINSSQVRVEIPYNTKYKRLKRNRLNKERMAATQVGDAAGEMQDDVTFYSLGDLFLSPEEASEWQIHDWPPEDEQKMENEAYEWIRVDADFEWICRTYINDMPSYMYVSQLQQDKDVVAQAQSIQYLARKEGHRLISSFLVKTLMDNRYFHGIRTMAAEVLANQCFENPQTKEWDTIGLFHLTKAFRELFCIANSPMTRSNDFSDRASYNIQCIIPKAISRTKGADGKAPMEAKRFLLDVMRYNDNRGNDFSDDHYLATLMQCLTDCLINTRPSPYNVDPTLNLVAEAEQHDFKKASIDELQRHLRLDEWIPTYQNVYTTTVLECLVKLVRNRVEPFKVVEFLQYTQIGNAENVRLKAWECLVQLGIFNNRDSVVKYMMHEIQWDPSPHFKAQLLRIFDVAVGQIAVGDVFTPEDPEKATGGLVLEEEIGVSNRAAELARRKLDGALRGLRTDMANNEMLKSSLEAALKAKSMSVRDVSELLDFCGLIVDPVNTLRVEVKYKRYWKVQRADRSGGLWLRFWRGGRYMTELKHPVQQPVPPVKPAKPEKPEKPKEPEKLAQPAPPQDVVPQAPPPPPPRTGTGLKLTLKSKQNGPSLGLPPNATPSPASADAPAVPQLSSQRTGSHASQSSAAPASKKSSSPAPIPTPSGSYVLSPPALVAQSSSPATLPQETSTPMEGIELPTPVQLPPPVTAQTPSATRKPSSAPTIKIKALAAAKPPKAPKAPKAPKGKKSHIVKLKLPPETLARIGSDENVSRKRKADELIEASRLTKRQSMDPLANGNGVARNHKVHVERTGGEKPRLLLKFSVGKGKLPME